VTFAGTDLRDATQRSLRERIVVVPQEGFLFNGTIRDNIRIARGDATDDEIDEALAAVGVLERFSSLPQGLGTEVRERGSRLSAGEKRGYQKGYRKGFKRGQTLGYQRGHTAGYSDGYSAGQAAGKAGKKAAGN